MDKIKINLDREKLSSEYIHSKQDFNKVQSQVTAMPKSIFKSAWFFGAVGIASVTTFVLITFNNSTPTIDDYKTTLSAATIFNSKQEALADNNSANVFLTSRTKANTTKQEKDVVKVNVVEKKKSSVVIKKNDSTPIEKEKMGEKVDYTTTDSPVIVENLTIKPTQPEKINYFPKINGVFEGEIPQSKLCGAGIEVNPSVHILNFTINYSTNRGDKTTVIEGNKLPQDVCKEMKQYGIDQMIFITDITGTDKNGKLLRFTSMNLIALID